MAFLNSAKTLAKTAASSTASHLLKMAPIYSGLTSTPSVAQIGGMVSRIRERVPTAKLVYNNSPSFNWTLNFRQQVFDAWAAEGRDLTNYERANLMAASYDGSELAQAADERVRSFQRDAAREAGVFHHLITLPTYHTAALSTDNLAKGYFGDEGMLAYVAGVQRREIREKLACVKHQDMAGSNMGDDHKTYFSGEAALKAGGKDNTDESVWLSQLRYWRSF